MEQPSTALTTCPGSFDPVHQDRTDGDRTECLTCHRFVHTTAVEGCLDFRTIDRHDPQGGVVSPLTKMQRRALAVLAAAAEEARPVGIMDRTSPPGVRYPCVHWHCVQRLRGLGLATLDGASVVLTEKGDHAVAALRSIEDPEVAS